MNCDHIFLIKFYNNLENKENVSNICVTQDCAETGLHNFKIFKC